MFVLGCNNSSEDFSNELIARAGENFLYKNQLPVFKSEDDSLRRFLNFFQEIITDVSVKEVSISSELLKFFNSVKNTLENNKSLLNGPITDFDRKQILDGLGTAASNYRTKIYNDSFSGEKTTIEIKSISSFVNIALDFLEHSIDSNKALNNVNQKFTMHVKGK